MQHLCYYSTIAELEKEGIEGKTFLEVGCGPCPIGQRLAVLGARKVIGLDVSAQMLESAKKTLTAMKIVDKFEFLCSNILDDDFQLAEKVDCVIASYMLTACIDSYDTLEKFFFQCAKTVKEDGYLFVADFSWVRIPQDGFWMGQYTQFGTKDSDSPDEFETFDFIIEKEPDKAMKIVNIPSYLMYKAGSRAGFNQVVVKPQYPHPAYKNNKVIRRYLDTCGPCDYLIKFKQMTP